MKVTIYSFTETQGKRARRTQRTYSKLTPVQAAKLLRANELSFNPYDEQYDNDEQYGRLYDIDGVNVYKVAAFRL